MKRKIPTQDDFRNYTGLHCHRLWAEVGDDFICPGCGRTKFQMLHWGKRFPKSQSSFMDWVAVLHRHHDHSQGVFRFGEGRFPETVICDQCNSADGAAKRRLVLPRGFSFSPSEISQFIKSTPHGKHEIDFDAARIVHYGLI